MDRGKENFFYFAPFNSESSKNIKNLSKKQVFPNDISNPKNYYGEKRTADGIYPVIRRDYPIE